MSSQHMHSLKNSLHVVRVLQLHIGNTYGFTRIYISNNSNTVHYMFLPPNYPTSMLCLNY